MDTTDQEDASPQSLSSNTKHECLQSWSMMDLRTLRKHIKTKELYKELRHKSKYELNYVVTYVTSEAMSLLNSTQKALLKKKLRRKLNCEPLNNWALLLQRSYNLEELKTDLANSVRIILEFEDIWEPKGDVDLRKIYLCMVNALEGRTLPSLSGETQRAYNTCLVRTMHAAKMLRSRMGVQIESYIAKRMLMHDYRDVVDCQGSWFVSDNSDKRMIEEFCSQSCYNPFRLLLADTCLRE